MPPGTRSDCSGRNVRQTQPKGETVADPRLHGIVHRLGWPFVDGELCPPATLKDRTVLKRVMIALNGA